MKQGFGLIGDAHGGVKERQVSILLEQFVEPVIKKLGQFPEPGSFAENLLVRGLPESSIVEGTILRVGEAAIEIMEIGKADAHNHTYSYEGFSLLAKQGLFGRVMQSGHVKVGDVVEKVEK